MEDFIENLRERLKEDPDLILEIPVTVRRITEDEAIELRKELDKSDEEINHE